MNAVKFVPPDPLRYALCLLLVVLTASYVTPAVVAGGPMPATLAVKLYPGNDLADRTGVLAVEVAILSISGGRFTFSYDGETLAGEAKRLASDGRRGVANAHGQRGMSVRCEYQTNSPRISGACVFSNGARYALHVGA